MDKDTYRVAHLTAPLDASGRRAAGTQRLASGAGIAAKDPTRLASGCGPSVTRCRASGSWSQSAAVALAALPLRKPPQCGSLAAAAGRMLPAWRRSSASVQDPRSTRDRRCFADPHHISVFSTEQIAPCSHINMGRPKSLG